MERTEHAAAAAETKAPQFSGVFEYTNSDTLHNLALALGKVTGALRPDGEPSAFRLNVRETRLEYRAAFTGVWHYASPAWFARLLEEGERIYWLQRHGWKAKKPLRFSQVELERSCLVLADKYPCDPFKDWLRHALPEWDGVERIAGLLTATFGAADKPLTRWGSRYLLLAPVQRAMEPGCQLREMPVLIGPQGVGKSALLRELFPQAQQARWFSDSYSLHEQDPGRQIEATAGAALVEIPELAGLRKAEIERVKADISRREDRWRLAYRRDAEAFPRRFAFVGTSNERSVLPDDPSGNTRFVPIVCPNPYHVEKGLRAGRAFSALPRETHLKDLGRPGGGKERSSHERPDDPAQWEWRSQPEPGPGATTGAGTRPPYRWRVLSADRHRARRERDHGAPRRDPLLRAAA